MCLPQEQGQTQASGLPNKANHIPFAIPGALSVLTFVGFNQNRSKGGGCSFAGEQRVPVTPLSPLPAQERAPQRTLGE